MKQIQKTPKISDRLQKAVGEGVSTDDLTVYEAIAFNTLPIRKESTLYKGAVAERGILLDMAQRINTESLPVQIMHDREPLPVGRVFAGEVINTSQGAELRVLFSISNTEQDVIKKVDNGTVDQVSVSIMPKQILCSKCGFDFLGDAADFEHVYMGKCDLGHRLGEGGVHAKLVGLDNFYEMSLVGRGGAQNARIVPRDKSTFGSTLTHLAASGVDLNKLVLSASTETNLMDIEKLVGELTDAKADVKLKDGQIASLQADVQNKDGKIAELTAQLEAAAKPADLKAATDELEATKTELELATGQLKDIAKGVLVSCGDVNPTVPEKVADLIAVIKDKGSKMVAFLAGGARSVVEPEKKELPKALGAFRSR